MPAGLPRRCFLVDLLFLLECPSDGVAVDGPEGDAEDSLSEGDESDEEVEALRLLPLPFLSAPLLRCDLPLRLRRLRPSSPLSLEEDELELCALEAPVDMEVREVEDEEEGADELLLPLLPLVLVVAVERL